MTATTELDYPVVHCRFRMASRGPSVLAVGRVVNLTHQHVLRLVVQRTPLARCMHWLVSRLPSSRPRLLAALPPAWWLPSKIVVKRLKPDWDDEFANEMSMYDKMRPLQGRVIPVCYGEASCQDGTRAMVLSDVGGFPLWADEALTMDEERLTEATKEAFAALSSYGVCYDDIKLDNFHMVGNRAVILDLESVGPRTLSYERAVVVSVDATMEQWNDLRLEKEDYKKSMALMMTGLEAQQKAC